MGVSICPAIGMDASTPSSYKAGSQDFGMNYQRFFEEAVDQIHAERRYRVFADLERKRIPSLAWDFAPYSNCAPDLVQVTHDADDIRPTAWGTSVRDYLRAH